eukprot:CAMPEP_0185589628 /NCGR_PEP_ID=MMETSP0434-20130131/57743_1 /TAXON_ID=626734 ORGANISM="Favella taraikaensis, Strain Fe Narragansett Bay" /NCGR_SAMPLE_ID=MMETSP0434 /ASSEMBLY_ACC=CAM_ASM_000379 /LENGTH=94 /DNA_ID=CAMNT_0028213179 /DNA_START=53 /DNA_END=337 /DNA_ORIENTATION=-
MAENGPNYNQPLPTQPNDLIKLQKQMRRLEVKHRQKSLKKPLNLSREKKRINPVAYADYNNNENESVDFLDSPLAAIYQAQKSNLRSDALKPRN